MDGHSSSSVRARASRGPRRRSRSFATKPRLRLRRRFTLRGDFSYDALSPDGRALFLINYLSARDPTRYRVRVYDLARRRLDPKPIVDPREPPDAMNGLPMTRVTSRDGRWAYTLYDGAGKHPFIHALDTTERRAVCIDLRDPAFARNPGKLRLRLAGGGRLEVLRAGGARSRPSTRGASVSEPSRRRRRRRTRAARQAWRPRSPGSRQRCWRWRPAPAACAAGAASPPDRGAA